LDSCKSPLGVLGSRPEERKEEQGVATARKLLLRRVEEGGCFYKSARVWDNSESKFLGGDKGDWIQRCLQDFQLPRVMKSGVKEEFQICNQKRPNRGGSLSN